MRFDPPLTPGRLLQRYKRFLADVELADGTVETVHCANSGSMLGCSVPGSPVLLSHSLSPTRKLPYTLELIFLDGCWVGINTMRPNGIVREGIQAQRVPELAGYDSIRSEVYYPRDRARQAALSRRGQAKPDPRRGKDSRVDLLLEGARGLCYVEVKGVTLIAGDVAYFPDSVSERAAKHLDELRGMVKAGHRAVLFYLVHRGDCSVVRPADAIDPHYGRTLRRAARAGVEVLAYRAHVSPDGVHLAERLDVSLTSGRRGWTY